MIKVGKGRARGEGERCIDKYMSKKKKTGRNDWVLYVVDKETGKALN